jgi:signal transduction histidine kinase/ActR/RegA family two-component response regulator
MNMSEENPSDADGLLHEVPFGLAVIDAVHGLILETNRAAERLLGLAPGSVVSFADVVGGDSEELLRGLDQIHGYETRHFAFRSRPSGEDDCLIHAWACRVQVNDRSLIYCTFMRPAADHLLAELEQLRQSADQARARAAELEAATRRLSLADLRKDEFLAQLAHEIRNPLAPIRLWTQRLLDSAEAPPLVKRASEVVDRQVRHLTRLVEDLGEVSRFVWGKVTLKQELAPLGDAIDLAVQMARPSIEERRQELVVSIGPTALWVRGDLARLAEVFHNLLDNAAKYTPPGGRIRLTVREEQVEAVVKVDDDGIGIDPDFLPHVFDLFSRSPRAEKLPAVGLGLGLSLVQQMVLAHGGTVIARSPGSGRGSEFEVRLPLAQAPPPAVAVEAALGESRPRHRILVVDDDRDVAEALALYLEDQGQDVRVARDGASGLALAESFRPRIVLLDVGMPGFDGHELARRLRTHPGCENTVMLAISGYDSEADRRRSLAAGCDDHLVKPIDPLSLMAIIADCDRRAAARP